jgi:hypothetical protein
MMTWLIINYYLWGRSVFKVYIKSLQYQVKSPQDALYLYQIISHM